MEFCHLELELSDCNKLKEVHGCLTNTQFHCMYRPDHTELHDIHPLIFNVFIPDTVVNMHDRDCPLKHHLATMTTH